MNRQHRRRKLAITWGLLGLLGIGILVPAAYSGHFNDLLSLPMLGDSTPEETGVDPFDDAVREAAEIYDERAAAVNDARPWKQEPEIPATFFYDGLEANSRIGGWGDYDTSLVGAGADTWRLETIPPGDVVYRFWDPATGWYPTGTTEALDAYLVTPRISLKSIPVDPDAVRSCAGAVDCPGLVENNVPSDPDASQVPTGASKITLTVSSRVNLGTGDVGRILAFVDEPPAASTLADGQVLRDGITGASDGFENITVGLDPFAGRDVWLAFHVRVQPVSDRSSHFTDPSVFESSADFGWAISSFTVEGPAYAFNLRIDEFLPPARCDDETDGSVSCLFPSGSDQDSLSVLVMNRGQTTETAVPSLELRRAEGGPAIPCPPDTSSVTLRPGAVHSVEFACGDGLVEGDAYRAVFRVEMEGEGEDLHPADDTLIAHIFAERGRQIVWDPVGVVPPTGGDNEPRELAFQVRNSGLSREALVVSLRFLDEEGSDVTFGDEIEFLEGGGSKTVQELDLRPGEGEEFVWRFLVPVPGIYRAVISVETAAGETLGELEGTVSTLFSQSVLYQDGFDGGDPIDTIVWGPRDEWTVERWRDDPPPNYVPDSGQWVWSMERFAPRRAGDPYVQFLPEPGLTEGQGAFDAIRVEVLRYMDIRCTDKHDSRQTSYEGGCRRASPSPTGRFSTVELSLDLADKTSIQPADPRLDLVLHKFGDEATNQWSQYSGRWTTETFVIAKEEISSNVDEFPAAFSLRVYHQRNEFCQFLPSEGPNGQRNHNCAIERVAQVAIFGVSADGRALPEPIIFFNGGVDGEYAERGHWETGISDGIAGQNQCVVFTGNCEEFGWFRTPLDGLTTPAVPADIDTWRQADISQMVGGDGVWTTSDDALRYDDGARDALISPAMRIPESASDPTLVLRHKFDSLDLPYQPDAGMVFVRYLDAEGLEPVTPFMPVAIRLDESGAAVDPAHPAQRFDLSDCEYYGASHPDAGGTVACDEIPLQDRQVIAHSLSLSALPILNYTRLIDVRQTNPWGDVDAAALEPEVDLRSRVVQFAFVLETLEPVRNAHANLKASARAGSVGGQGWFIDDVTVRADSRLGHDISVESIAATTTYDWPSLGLGPGSELALDISIENHGIFEEDQIRLTFELEEVATATIHKSTIVDPPGLTIPSQQSRSVTVPLQIPDDVGEYRLLVSATLHGDVTEGKPLVDEDLTNNCAALSEDGTPALGVCSLDDAPTLSVRRTEQLGIELSVAPEAGRFDFPREVDIRIENQGNVHVDGTTLTLIMENVETEKQTVFSWNLVQSPAPSQTRSWTDPEVSLEPARPQVLFPLEEQGRYVFTARLSGPGINAIDQRVIEAFENFYSDRFEPGSFEGSHLLSGSLNTQDPSWAQIDGASFGGGSSSWHFGDLERQRYPENTDSHLEFPQLDLSTASKARFSMAHRHSFEAGYDGGRVEVSLDDGESWRLLEPVGAYPASLHPRTAADVRDLDPGQLAAFSGDSLAQAPQTEGWVISEFDLGNIDELTTDVSVQRFSQDGFLDRINTQDGRISSDTSWSQFVGSCPAGCWYRENLRFGDIPARNPANHPAGHPLTEDTDFWWSGSLGDLVAGNGYQTVLPLQVDLSGIDPGVHRALITFWIWKDEGGELQTRVDDGGPVTPVESVVVEEGNDGWTRYQIDVTRFEGDVELHIGYSESQIFRRPPHGIPELSQESSNLGLVVDDVELEVLDLTKSPPATIPSMASSFPTTSGAWQTPLNYKSDDDLGFPVEDFQEDWCDVGLPCGFRWQTVPSLPPVENAWHIEPHADRFGQSAEVWWFGEREEIGDGGFTSSTYPGNARERLVTPLISLREIGGSEASLQYWEHFDIARYDERRVFVKVIEPLLDIDTPWVEIRHDKSTQAVTSEACTETEQWCLVDIPLSEYIGRDIRIAFEFDATRVDLPREGPTDAGYHWAIDGVGIQAESLAGMPVRMRLNATTDTSLSAAGWTVDNLQVVGFSYGKNVAILPDKEGTELRLAPGGTLDLQGVIRNLGSQREGKVYLAATVEGIKEIGQPSPPPPELVEFVSPDGTVEPTPVSFDLGAAGLKNTAGEFVDRRPFHLRIHFPATVDNVHYRLALTALDDPAAPSSMRDDNLGDHERVYEVHLVTSSEVKYDQAVVDAPTVSSADSVHLAVRITNAGTITQAPVARFQVTHLETGTTSTSPGIQAPQLESSGRFVFDWDWTADGAGMHEVVVEVDRQGAGGPTIDRLVLGHVLVDRLPIFFRDDVDPTAESQWTTNPAAPHALCQAGLSDPTSDPWRLAELGFDGGTAFHSGVVLGVDEANSYQPRQDSILQAPLVDLSELAPLVAPAADVDGYDSEPSVFNPFLSFRYRSVLGTNDGVIVQAARQADAVPRWIPGSYDGEVHCGNPLSDDSVRPAANGGQRPAFASQDEAWKVGEMPLGGNILKNDANQLEPLLGHPVHFSWRFGSDSQGESIGFTLDDVSVSAYNASVVPAEQHASLRSGADKTFHFLVTNNGAAHDVFDVRLDPILSLFPAYYDVGVSPAQLDLDPGQAAPITVHVAVGDDPGFPPSANDVIAINVISEADPTRVRTATLVIDKFAPTLLPDLQATIQPAGASEELVEGDQGTFLVTVQNIGKRATVVSDLVVFACLHEPDEDVAASVSACAGRQDIGLFSLPPLPSIEDVGFADRARTVHSQKVAWKTELGQHGDYLVVAMVDPQGINQESNRANNVDAVAANVLPLEQPDLRVLELSVRDASGSPVHEAGSGDVLTVSGAVTNSGTADANNVVVKLSNRFVLTEEFLPVMPPGKTVSFTTQWIAKPGNWLVALEAGTPTAERRSDNNARNWPLAIRQASFDVSFEPGVLHLSSGGGRDGQLTIQSGRDTPVEVALDAKTPAGVSLIGLPAVALLRPAVAEEVRFVVTASPFASGAAGDVIIEVRDVASGVQLGSATARVFVDAERRLVYSTDDVIMPPGTGDVTIRVQNVGGAPEFVHPRVTIAGGWGIQVVPRNLVVEPGEFHDFTVALQSPDGAEPGSYPVTVFDADGSVVASAVVEVVRSPRWVTEVEDSRVTAAGEKTVWLRIQNAGNAPGFPPAPTVPTESGFTVTVVPPLHSMNPGETAVHQVVVTGSFSAVSKAVLAVPGNPSVPLTETPASFGIELVSWEILPREGILAGDAVQIRVEIRNSGSAAVQEVPVRAFLDGRLVSEAVGTGLDPGERQVVRLTWTAIPGRHVLSVSAGPAETGVTRATAVVVEAPDAAVPDVALPGILAAVALAALLMHRGGRSRGPLGAADGRGGR